MTDEERRFDCRCYYRLGPRPWQAERIWKADCPLPEHTPEEYAHDRLNS